MPEILSESIKKAIKKEYVKSKVKSLIAESVMLLIETKLKIIRQKFQELLNNNKITEDEYRSVFKFDKSGVLKARRVLLSTLSLLKWFIRHSLTKKIILFLKLLTHFQCFNKKLLMCIVKRC